MRPLCAEHKTEYAIGVCDHCGITICRDCVTGPGTRCQPCGKRDFEPVPHARRWTLAAGIIVQAVALASGLFMLPIPSLILLALTGPLFLGAWVVVFQIWNHGLNWGRAETPLHSWILVFSVVILQASYFLANPLDSLRYARPEVYEMAVAIFLAWAVFLCVLFSFQRRRPSFFGNLAVHTILFSYIAGAFLPYFGELP